MSETHPTPAPRGVSDAAALEAVRHRYVEALLAGDTIAARGLVDESLRLVDVAGVYLRVVQPALYEVGVRWEEARIGVGDEHVATSVSEVVLADLAGRLPQRARRKLTALVACGPGELHAVGSRVVADFLDADGWDVLHLGATTPGGALAELVVARQASLVAVSIALPQRIPEVAGACRRLRALPRPPLIALGGQAFAEPALALRAGADVAASSPTDLVRQLSERFAR
jgi:methanogenic corrinoid protein MtbC1